MKPKTKKIIIAAALAIVILIVWLVVRNRRKNNTSVIISRLSCEKDLKDALSAMVVYINTSWDEAHKQAIAEKAAATGHTQEQETVIAAAYALYDAKQIDAATYNSIIAQIH